MQGVFLPGALLVINIVRKAFLAATRMRDVLSDYGQGQNPLEDDLAKVRGGLTLMRLRLVRAVSILVAGFHLGGEQQFSIDPPC